MSATLPTTLRASRSSSAIAHLIEGVGGRTDRGDPPVADQGQQIVQERLLIGPVLHGPDPPVDAEHGPVAQQHLVERDLRYGARGEADDQVATTIAQGAQRRLGRGAADGINHHIDAGPARPGASGVLDRFGGGVDHRLGPGRPGRPPLVVARRGADDPATKGPRHRDRRQADATPGAEHENGFTRLHPGPLAQGEQAGAEALREGGRLSRVELLGDRRQRVRGDHHVAGVAAQAGRGHDPAARRRSGRHRRPPPR